MERDAEAFLTALDEKLPELEIVAYVIHVDVEYTGEGTPNILCSPAGDSCLHLDNYIDFMMGEMAELPDEDWISCGWRHRGSAGRLERSRKDPGGQGTDGRRIGGYGLRRL